MPLPPGSPRDLARRLIDRETARSNEPHAAAAARHAVCGDLYRELGRWVGAEGCRALFRRALADARRDAPELSDIDVGLTSGACPLDGVEAAIAAHGDAAVATALETLLDNLLDLLARFIGADLVVTLAEPGRADPPSGRRNEESN